MEYNESAIIKNKNTAIKDLENYLNECILSDKKHQKKANLISYWLKDYTKYLSEEESFDSSTLKHYSRGDVIKANLGFNVGNEEGGLHYCIVLDKINSRKYSTLTVIPLSSIKPNKKISNTSVLLGDELFKKLSQKCINLIHENGQRAIEIQKKLEDFYNKQIPFKPNPGDFETMQYANLAFKIGEEVKQMKSGSVALVNQITTISKQRIYEPKNDLNILSGIKISPENLDLIDKKIKELFLKN